MQRHRGPALWIAAALIAATLAVYGQVGTHAFLTYDDEAYVTENPHVLGGLSASSICWAIVSFDYFYWHPLTWLSHMLDYQLFGLRAGWHHATNLLLHIASSLLVFFVFRRMTGAVWRSALVAGLFALHPLRVESVSWVAERKDVLSGFWLVVTLWTYARYAERPGNRRYGLVLLAMIMGLMSKPMMVTAPLLLLALDYWPLRRLGRRAVIEKLPMLVLAALSAALTVVGQHRMGAMPADISLPLRIENTPVSYARYLAKTIWPAHLAIFYPFPVFIPVWQWAGAAVLLAGITIAVWRTRRACPYLVTGWAWFMVGLLPTIGLVQVGRQAMADRFTYIPLIGVFAAAVWGAAVLLRQHRRLGAIAAGAVLGACAAQSWIQERTWRDNITVFSHAIAVTPPNPVAQYHLALGLEAGGNRNEALRHYAEAVKLRQSYYPAQMHYGAALLASERPEEAEIQFADVIRQSPDDGSAYYGLGKAAMRMGKREQAAAMLETALRLGLRDGDMREASRALRELSMERSRAGGDL